MIFFPSPKSVQSYSPPYPPNFKFVFKEQKPNVIIKSSKPRNQNKTAHRKKNKTIQYDNHKPSKL